MSLRKPGRETDKEVMDYVNSFSPSFCAAKWYNATIWLGSGMTTSCHHPPAHRIPLEHVKANPKAIHNTRKKKGERHMMQQGQRPAECQYCWKIEDMEEWGKSPISDRCYKSVIYNDEDIEYAAKADFMEDINLKTLEIAFDRTCNLACSYCNPAFSSTWVKDIKNNGPYIDLVSDGRNHFTHTHDEAEPYGPKEENPYVEAFFKWWDSDLKHSLQELRLTGGEPLMSGHTWRLLDKFIEDKPDMQFALNSNLMAKDSLLDKLIEASHSISNFQLYTSNESMLNHANYIRDGLHWDTWHQNIHKILREGSVQGFHMMCTINALCLESLHHFLDYLLSLKEEYGKDYPTFTLNILRFPSFQSPLVLPDDLRMERKEKLQQWYNDNKNNPLLHQMELNQLQRLIDYLDVVKTPHDESFELTKLRNDFKQFYEQYDARRGKDFRKTFFNLAQWYDEIETR